MENLPSWLLTQTAAHAHRLVSEGMAAVNARGYHYRLLATLAETGPASQADLGRRSGIHLSDLVAALNELQGQGFAQRSPDPQDRRCNIITITPTGQRQLKRLGKQIGKIQDELLNPLSPAERNQLTSLLSRLLNHHTSR